MALTVQNPPPNAGDVRDVGLIPGMGRSLGGGHIIKSLHCHFKLIHWGSDVNFLQVYITFITKNVHPKHVSTQKLLQESSCQHYS